MRALRLFTAFLLVSSLAACRTEPMEEFPDERYATDCGVERETTEGPVTGVRSRSGRTCAYLGIPFAKPPVGALRFAPPQPPAPRAGVFKASEPGDICLQKFQSSMLGDGAELLPPFGSEDCLSLNIWRSRGENLPVMVFIHGGAFVLGAGSWDIYDGDLLAQEGAVIVTINYRLGPLGFFASPAVKDESADGSAGNQGIQDQIRALEWVRDNIAAFGGNSDKVTIFGESAGGMSVCTLLASPQARDLFDGAIIESGACTAVSTLERGYANAVTFASQAGCDPLSSSEDQLACLRDVSADTLLEKLQFDTLSDGLQPHVDGVVLTDTPLAHIESGDYNRVPVLGGSNAEEVLIISMLNPYSQTLKSLEWERYYTALASVFGDDDAAELRTFYGPDRFENPFASWYRLKSDYVLSCPTSIGLNALSKNEDVFHYLFDWNKLGTLEDTFATVHGLELFFVFGTWDAFSLAIPDSYLPEAKLLSERMRRLWTSFARDGRPAAPGVPEWPTFEGGAMVLDETPEVDSTVLRAECEFWKSRLPIGMDELTRDVSEILEHL